VEGQGVERGASGGERQGKGVLPYAALAVGVLSLSMSGIFVRWSQAAGPVTSFYRMSLAALLLLPVMAWHWRRQEYWRRGQRPQMRWLIFPIIGGVFTALDHGTWSSAIGYTRVANATLLNNIAPLWVALFAALVWRERLRGRFWLGLAITLAGAAAVLGADLRLAPDLTRGNLLAVLSSAFYAGYFIVTQMGRRKVDVLNYIWLVAVFAALGLLGASQAMRLPLSGFNAATWLIFLLAALISQVSGYFAVAYALGRLPASVVAPTMVFQPVLSALIAVPLTGETLAPLQWLGALAVVGGIYWVNVSGGERENGEKTRV
jgi:drug/metabolite transporter (DMT)-like permease